MTDAERYDPVIIRGKAAAERAARQLRREMRIRVGSTVRLVNPAEIIARFSCPGGFMGAGYPCGSVIPVHVAYDPARVFSFGSGYMADRVLIEWNNYSMWTTLAKIERAD